VKVIGIAAEAVATDKEEKTAVALVQSSRKVVVSRTNRYGMVAMEAHVESVVWCSSDMLTGLEIEVRRNPFFLERCDDAM